MSSSPRPSAASLVGSTCTRTDGFCTPPTLTKPTPSSCEICWARILSAASFTRVSGRGDHAADVLQPEAQRRELGRVDLHAHGRLLHAAHVDEANAVQL